MPEREGLIGHTILRVDIKNARIKDRLVEERASLYDQLRATPSGVADIKINYKLNILDALINKGVCDTANLQSSISGFEGFSPTFFTLAVLEIQRFLESLSTGGLANLDEI